MFAAEILNAQTLPWYLISGLFGALIFVFYAVVKGKLLPARIAEMLRESAEKRAESAEAAAAESGKSISVLADQVEKLTVAAETQEKLLVALKDTARRNRGGRGDNS